MKLFSKFLTFAQNPTVFLVICSIIICLVRYHTIHEPFERDIGTYAVYGHELLSGKLLYIDLFDHKPPLVYVTYAFFEYIFGYGDRTIWLINVTFSIFTLIALYFIGLKLNKLAGYLTALTWTILSGNIPLQANQPNVEVFLNTLLTASFALLIYNKNNSIKKNTILGLLLGISSLFKHITFVPIILFSLLQILNNDSTSSSKKLLSVLPISVVPVLLWFGTFGYYFVNGWLDNFIYAVFYFNMGYSGTIEATGETTSIVKNIIIGLKPTVLLTKRFISFIPFVLLFIMGLINGIISRKYYWYSLLVYTISVILMISIPGKWYPHYYQLWLPIFTIGSSWLLFEYITTNSVKKFQNFTIIILLFLSACVQFRFIFWTPNDISRIKYGNTFVETKKTSEFINTILPASETFFQYGSDPILYYYAKRPLPTGITFMTFLDYGSHSDLTTKTLLQDLSISAPELIVLNIPTLNRTNLSEIKPKNEYHNAVLTWINNNYIESSVLGKGYLIKRNGVLNQKYK